MKLFRTLRDWQRRRVYKPGAVVGQFLVPDVFREVQVVDVTELRDGFIEARVRTWNVLYEANDIEPKPPFGPVERLSIDDLWDWTGEPWGGPVP